MITTRLTARILLLVALAAAGPLGCARRDAADGGRSGAAAPGRPGTGSTGAPAPSVTAIRVGAETQGNALLLPARVAAREEVTVTSTIAARLTALPYREGQSFPEGAVIAAFDAPETRDALEGARAGLDAAALRRDLARKQEARLDSLYAQRVAALREVELARQEREGSEAAWAAARATDATLRAGALVRAPFAGVIVRHRVDPGINVGPGEPLLDIRSGGAVEIVAAVPEGSTAALRGAVISVQVGDGAWRPAALSRLEGMTDFTTRTVTARFRMAGAAGTPLEPGAFARVRIEPREGSAPTAAAGGATADGSLAVPVRSLVRRGGLTGVFVLQDGRAALRWIRLGRIDGGEAEVLAGLSPGEEIAAEPQGLADGQAVTVRR